MRFFLLALLAATLCGCGLIYKLPTRQGNVIEQKELDKLQVGMTRDQVKFVLGTPMAASPLQPDRWDYLGYYKSPRGATFSRTVTLFFEGDKLARMEGLQATAQDGSTPDVKALRAEEQKARTEEERAKEKTDSGIVITPKQ